MAVWEDVEAVNASTTLTREEIRAERHRLKVGAIVSILNNGDTTVSPAIAPVVGKTFKIGDLTVTIHYAGEAWKNGTRLLHLILTVSRNGTVIITRDDTVYIGDPPVYGSGRTRDLIQAAKDIIQNLARGR